MSFTQARPSPWRSRSSSFWKPRCCGPASARNMPIWAIVKEQRSRAKTGSSSSVSQPGCEEVEMPAELGAARVEALDPRPHRLRKAGLGRLDRRDIDPHAAHAELVHLGEQRVRRILVHVDDAAAARDPDLAHGIEHAGIVAAIGARLHEHEALEAEQPRRAPDSPTAARAAARSAGSRSPRHADSVPPGRTHGNARRTTAAARETRAAASFGWLNGSLLDFGVATAW